MLVLIQVVILGIWLAGLQLDPSGFLQPQLGAGFLQGVVAWRLQAHSEGRQTATRHGKAEGPRWGGQLQRLRKCSSREGQKCHILHATRCLV